MLKVKPHSDYPPEEGDMYGEMVFHPSQL